LRKLFSQLGYGLKKLHQKTKSFGNPFPIVGDHFTNFYNNNLPFELTNAQKRVLKEIRTDMKRSTQMNRLLQGDVGSGKTMVALLTMLIAMDNGFQSCLMAPTEIGSATFQFDPKLQNTDINVRLLTGSSKASERKIIHEELENGQLSILIGTHAIMKTK
jgi:ATP-dependent DNA helicase RecG